MLDKNNDWLATARCRSIWKIEGRRRVVDKREIELLEVNEKQGMTAEIEAVDGITNEFTSL